MACGRGRTHPHHRPRGRHLPARLRGAGPPRGRHRRRRRRRHRTVLLQTRTGRGARGVLRAHRRRRRADSVLHLPHAFGHGRPSADEGVPREGLARDAQPERHQIHLERFHGDARMPPPRRGALRHPQRIRRNAAVRSGDGSARRRGQHLQLRAGDLPRHLRRLLRGRSRAGAQIPAGVGRARARHHPPRRRRTGRQGHHEPAGARLRRLPAALRTPTPTREMQTLADELRRIGFIR